MSAVNNLLDKYREICRLTSDSALGDSLKMTRQGVHQWRKGLSWPTEEHIIAMAKAIDEPAERWLAAISMDRAPKAAKQYWEKLLNAAACLAVAIVISSTPTKTSAKDLSIDAKDTSYTLCAIEVSKRAIGMSSPS